MEISFIPSTQTTGHYDLVVEGQSIMVDINPTEIVECIDKLRGQGEIIENFDLFLRASEKINFELPDPIVNPGDTQLLFVEENKKGFYKRVLNVYDRVAADGSSFIIINCYIEDPTNGFRSDMWGFYIDRNTKEVGEFVGTPYKKPWGELRSRILEVLTQRLGRKIKILI